MKSHHNLWYLGVHILIFIFLCSASSASDMGKTTEQNEHEEIANCHKICGCDRAFVYNETLKECVIDMKYILLTATITDRGYNNQDHDMANDDGMAKRIRVEAETVFRGMIISVIIFIACAGLCAFSACIYCCHINYSDRKLKNDVKALAKKLKTEYHSKKSVPKKPLEPIEESCNVMVGNSGVFVV